MILLNQLFIILYGIGYCSGRAHLSDIHCLDGPNYWCLNDTTEYLCNFTNKTVGLCEYSTKRCQTTTGDSFCKSSLPHHQQSPFSYNGGLTGTDDDLFSYYMLDLYWPPSSCPPHYNETLDFLKYFCSPYTDMGQLGRERLVLHGLWPTFATYGNYQGWPQFCSSVTRDWSQCHIDGNLCPWINATQSGFTQGDYEYCLSMENIAECLVNGDEVLIPEEERLKTLAPGYLGPRNLFVNHEWTKHGSCCSSIFHNNISYYVSFMLDLVDLTTRPGSLTYQYIQRNAGEKVGLDYLLAAFNQTAIINCNSKCELEEIQMCMNRNRDTGLPDQFITCPVGARNSSNSCKPARCEYVLIPLRNHRTELDINDYEYVLIRWKYILCLIFLLVLFKYLVFSCGAFYQFL